MAEIAIDKTFDFLARWLGSADCRTSCSLGDPVDPGFYFIDIAAQKIKKGDGGLNIELTRNPDILMEIRQQREQTGYPRMVVGFAAESENLVQNAAGKLERKGLDLLVANDITATDAGFAVDTNRVIILDAEGGQQSFDLASKTRIAETIIARAATLFRD